MLFAKWNTRPVTALAAVFGCVISTLPLTSEARAAGLFEALFGGGPVYYAPIPPREASTPFLRNARKELLIRKNRAGFRELKFNRSMHIESGKVRPRLAKISAAEAKTHVGPFIGDLTLRAGDVVVSSKGLYVFNGRSASRHRLSDFRPLENSRVRPNGDRKKLAQIQKANRQGVSKQKAVIQLAGNHGRKQGRDTKAASLGSTVASAD